MAIPKNFSVLTMEAVHIGMLNGDDEALAEHNRRRHWPPTASPLDLNITSRQYWVSNYHPPGPQPAAYRFTQKHVSWVMTSHSIGYDVRNFMMCAVSWRS